MLVKCIIDKKKLRCLNNVLRGKMTFSTYIITPHELSQRLKQKPDADLSTPAIIPVCATWFLPNDAKGRTGRQVFNQRRLPNSRFFDIDDVKDADSIYPHMLPSAQTFANTLQTLGIRPSDTVVVYDSHELGIFSAPRVGWTFRVFGHEKVHVLNNFRLWVDEKYELEYGLADKDTWTRSKYPVPTANSKLSAEFSDVKLIAQAPKIDSPQIVDARPYGRWAGSDPEPRPGLPSGHIPSSISIPFSDVLDPVTKAFLPPAQLKELFKAKGLDHGRPIITSCGTGVTAAVVEAALHIAGYGTAQRLSIYDGSWTEWAQRVVKSDNLIMNA